MKRSKLIKEFMERQQEAIMKEFPEIGVCKYVAKYHDDSYVESIRNDLSDGEEIEGEL